MAFPPAQIARLFISSSLAALLLTSSGCQRAKSPEEKALRTELRLALRDHSYEKATELGRRAVAFAPHDNGAWDRLVRAQIGMNDFAGARQTLTDWHRAIRNPSPKLDELAGNIADREGDHPRALQAWSKALARQRKNLRLLNKLALNYHANGDWAEEDAMLTRIIARQETGTARIARARCRRRMHRWTEALEDSARAQSIAPDDLNVRRGARLLDRLAKNLAAIRELDARLALTPDDDQSISDRALLYLRSEDAELALADAELASTKAPWSVRPKLIRAMALIDLGRAGECEALGVEKAIRLALLPPEFLDTISRLDSEISLERENADLYLARAWQLNEASQPQLALADAETAIHYDTNAAGAFAERSYALTKLGRAEEALEQIKRATELNTGLAPAWQYRGELEMMRADYPAAVESLSNALTISPTVAILMKREQCFRELGEIDKADDDRQALEALK